MTAYCWFCEQLKEYDGCESTKRLAYGYPFPMLDVTIRSNLAKDGEVLYFICEQCRDNVLRVLAESKVLSKDNVQKVAG